MKLFTFIADYKGGTYISQFIAETLESALLLWIDNVDFLTKEELNNFSIKLDNENLDLPTMLNGVENVWCTGFTIFKSYLLLNIVETVQ